jgi:hypothetical protein
MAFLDNSGDIILDAVLTETGRKRMAAGNFKISKFALGDDEIDYGLYNKNHPSGSAYYDLEILQTPILEAFTQMNANINYGLVTYGRTDLLYLPDIVLNQLQPNKAAVLPNANGTIFLADQNAAVGGTATAAALDSEASIATANVMPSGDSLGGFLLVETGIKSTLLQGSMANTSAYLTSVGLMDGMFTVSFDNRLIAAIIPGEGSSFANLPGSTTGEVVMDYRPAGGAPIITSRELANFAIATVRGIPTRVYTDGLAASAMTSLTNYTAISGPRGAFCAFAPVIKDRIPDATYSRLGKVNTVIDGSKLYNWVDTVIYVQGQSTNVTLQIPIRVIKYVS